MVSPEWRLQNGVSKMASLNRLSKMATLKWPLQNDHSKMASQTMASKMERSASLCPLLVAIYQLHTLRRLAHFSELR